MARDILSRLYKTLNSLWYRESCTRLHIQVSSTLLPLALREKSLSAKTYNYKWFERLPYSHYYHRICRLQHLDCEQAQHNKIRYSLEPIKYLWIPKKLTVLILCLHISIFGYRFDLCISEYSFLPMIADKITLKMNIDWLIWNIALAKPMAVIFPVAADNVDLLKSGDIP